MAIKFPVNCVKPGDRIAWLERFEEKLRLVRNGMGKWYRVSLTQTQYNKFPNLIKSKYTYKAQLTKAEWKDFVNNEFRPRIGKIMVARNAEWDKAKQDATTWNPNLDTDIS